PFNTLSDWLKKRFGCRVFKVTLDGGFTCPNRDGSVGTGGCVYCEPSALAPAARPGPGASIADQLTVGMEKVGSRYKAKKFIAYFQMNTNTYAPAEVLRETYGPALSHPDVVGLAVSTRPDCLGPDVLDLLSEIRTKKHLWVELGLQTADDAVLEKINRGHTARDFADAVGSLGDRGIDVCAHVIAGLPGEAAAGLLNTVGLISTLGVWGVKFHQLQVLRGAPLETLYNRDKVPVLGLEEYCSAVVECIETLRPDAVVHRLSGDAPGGLLLAPRWGANKFIITERVVEMMARRGTRQGSAYRQPPTPQARSHVYR
ncbi:MAG: TIGR01212 family radical SAM protein, partial [Thermodesulfobacteriota bacterium]